MLAPITVSAIIPTHKRPNLLRRAIESVLNQSDPVDEIIIVDDASCSETQNIVASFNSELIIYVRNPGVGASSSRNYGVHVSKCQFVAFLDDDDEWEINKVKIQKSMISKMKLDVCFSQILIVYEGTNIKYSTNASLPESPAVEICIENFIGGTISSMIRRDHFLAINGFDEDLPAREEYDLWIRLIHNSSTIGIVEYPLSIAYRSFNKRSRISSDIRNYENAIKILNTKHKVLVERLLSTCQLELRYRKQCEFLAAQAVSVGLRFYAVRCYIKSLRSKFSFKVAIMALVSFLHPVLLIRLRALVG